MNEPVEREDLITPCERTSLSSSDTMQTAAKEKDRLVNPAQRTYSGPLVAKQFSGGKACATWGNLMRCCGSSYRARVKKICGTL